MFYGFNILRQSWGVGGLLTALVDGAKWIWNRVFPLFGRVNECLDIFHATEHPSDCGEILYKKMRRVLLQSGFSGIDTRLQTFLFDEKWLVEKREAVQSLRDY